MSKETSLLVVEDNIKDCIALYDFYNTNYLSKYGDQTLKFLIKNKDGNMEIVEKIQNDICCELNDCIDFKDNDAKNLTFKMNEFISDHQTSNVVLILDLSLIAEKSEEVELIYEALIELINKKNDGYKIAILTSMPFNQGPRKIVKILKENNLFLYYETKTSSREDTAKKFFEILFANI